MAMIRNVLYSGCKCGRNLTGFNKSTFTFRNVQTSSKVLSEQGWLSKMLTVRKIDPGKDSHSRLLSEADSVYEMQMPCVKPDSIEPYLKNYEYFVNELTQREKKCDLVASWRVDIGDPDQFVHIWRYHDGYPNTTRIRKMLRTDETMLKLINEQNKYLRKRDTQLMMAFSYWGQPEPKVRNCMYEIRTYVLKPGTMIEWGNNWSRGINFRQNKVAGFFSQIGQLYTVHHIWHYDDLQNRKDVRENAWRKPGWDEIVAYTVPLIREMRSRWLYGNSFSPIR